MLTCPQRKKKSGGMLLMHFSVADPCSHLRVRVKKVSRTVTAHYRASCGEWKSVLSPMLVLDACRTREHGQVSWPHVPSSSRAGSCLRKEGGGCRDPDRVCGSSPRRSMGRFTTRLLADVQLSSNGVCRSGSCRCKNEEALLFLFRAGSNDDLLRRLQWVILRPAPPTERPESESDHE